MIGILGLALAAVYIAYVAWVAFGKRTETKTRSSTTEGFGCLFLGLGVPLVLGGAVTAVTAPPWHAIGLTAGAIGLIVGAGGALSVVGSIVAYSLGQQKQPRPGPPRAAVPRRGGDQPEGEGWTRGLAIGTVAVLLVLSGVALWAFTPWLRLAGIVAVAAGVVPVVVLLANAKIPVVGQALGSAGRSRLGALALLGVTAVNAPAIVLFGAALFIGDSPAYALRYGPEVAATIGDECTTTHYRVGEPETDCDATWVIDGETRSGRVNYRLDVPLPREPVPAHVRDAGSTLAYTAKTLSGPETSDDSSLILGAVSTAPLVPALVLEVLGWAVLLWWDRRIARSVAGQR